jgi:hypothetical protein
LTQEPKELERIFSELGMNIKGERLSNIRKGEKSAQGNGYFIPNTMNIQGNEGRTLKGKLASKGSNHEDGNTWFIDKDNYYSAIQRQPLFP